MKLICLYCVGYLFLWCMHGKAQFHFFLYGNPVVPESLTSCNLQCYIAGLHQVFMYEYVR